MGIYIGRYRMNSHFQLDSVDDFLYRKKGDVTLELKARRNTIVELFNNSSIYNFQKNLKYYYTLTMKK